MCVVPSEFRVIGDFVSEPLSQVPFRVPFWIFPSLGRFDCVGACFCGVEVRYTGAVQTF